MELTNAEIIGIVNTISTIVHEKVSGTLKFKLLRSYEKLSNEKETIIKSLDFKNNQLMETEDNLEILKTKQNVDIDKFKEEELSQISLSINDLILLKPIIEEEV